MSDHVVLSPRAQADLDEIWDYTEDRWGLDQAETYTRQLWKDIAIVANRPSLGRECNEVRRGYRMYPSGSHVLFYRHTADGIDIVRFLHERMDYERHIP
ncbi:MAG: toxin ParE1/3/4 [Gammaproteobacteria bacterium]|jgi:toxin ParE1/3/4|nr:toxin ParE1/3/4 [Gammaproteobacteria bacterium]